MSQNSYKYQKPVVSYFHSSTKWSGSRVKEGKESYHMRDICIRGGAGGGAMSRVGNDRGGNLTGGGKRPGGGSPVGKRRGEDAGGGTA